MEEEIVFYKIILNFAGIILLIMAFSLVGTRAFGTTPDMNGYSYFIMLGAGTYLFYLVARVFYK